VAKLHKFFQDDQNVAQEPQQIETAVVPQRQERLHKFFQDPIASETARIAQPESSVSKQIAKEGAAGLLGTYGDIAELIGVQKKGQPSLLPSQQLRAEKEAKATPEELIALSEEEDLVPQYGKLPTAQDIRKSALKFFNKAAFVDTRGSNPNFSAKN